MSITDDYNLIYKIAGMYFIDGMPQMEIAKKLGFSRASVCRALDAAKKMGMVNISISMPPAECAYDALVDKIKKKLRLKNVILAATAYSDDSPENLQKLNMDVASTAAACLPELLKDSYAIGISWGRTLYNTASKLPQVRDNQRRMFVPLVSNFSTGNSFLQTTFMVAQFVDKFNGSGYYLNISQMENRKGHRTAEELDQIRHLAVYWDMLDAAIVSFSSPDNLMTYEYCEDLWNREDEAAFYDKKSTAYFESMAQVFHEDGSYYRANPNFDIVAIDLLRLREIENVICIAAGSRKIDPIINAGKGGFYNILIMDVPTAKEMVKKL